MTSSFSFPVYADSLVGRGAELARLKEWQASGQPLVTLVGPAGIGKTRLACEFGARNEGPVDFCDLSETRDLDGICRVVARTLGVRIPSGGAEAIVTELGHVMASRGPRLIILDNVEQVVSHAEVTLRRWIALASATRFLVTSRELLRIPEEIPCEVLPLSLPNGTDNVLESEAVRLLLSCVRRIRYNHATVIGAAEADAVGEIVRQLDGLPLAIELVALRVQALGAAEVLRRLDRRFDLLTRGVHRPSAGSGERQQTLQTAIAWSWDLLSAHERNALAQCSVFRGGWGLEAAEAILALESASSESNAWVLDVIQSLRDKSLLTSHSHASLEGPSRFGMLVSIREFGTAALSPAETTDVRERHALYYLGEAERRADQLDGPGHTIAAAWLNVERENVLAAVEHALTAARSSSPQAERALRGLLALRSVVEASGPIAKHTQTLSSALEAVETHGGQAALCARGYIDRARFWLGSASGVLDADRAVSLAEKDGSLALRGRATATLARAQEERGRAAEAREAYRAAIELLSVAGDQLGEAMAYVDYGNFFTRHGDIVPASDCFERALVLAGATGSERLKAGALHCRGIVMTDDGRATEAQECFAEALKIYERMQNRRGIELVRFETAHVQHSLAHTDSAIPAYETAMVSLHALGEFRVPDRYILPCLILALCEAERPLEARSYAVKGLSRSEENTARTFITCGLGVAAGMLDDVSVSAAAFDAAAVGLDGDIIEKPLLTEILPLLQAYLDLARARAAAREGDVDRVEKFLACARERTEIEREASNADAANGSRPTAPRAITRIALRMVEGALGRTSQILKGETQADGSLRVHAGGAWFQLSGQAQMGCHRRAARLVLARLARERVMAPGRSVKLEDLVKVAWPDEKMTLAAAKNRARVTLTLLRKSGLHSLLESHQGGYRLSPDVPLALVEEP